MGQKVYVGKVRCSFPPLSYVTIGLQFSEGMNHGELKEDELFEGISCESSFW